MKKIIAILLAALLVCLAAFAEPAAELVSIEGTVLEITVDGWRIETETQGEVLVLASEETYVEASRDIAVGDYLCIDYDGRMTRSIPPQISASVVRMYVLEGSIVEALTEENAVLINTETHGEVMVNLPEAFAFEDAPFLTVYFDGAMTMSLPPQVSAKLVVPGYVLEGAVTEIGEDHLVLGEGAESVQVNLSADLPEDLAVGDAIQVVYNGQMTRSLPPQVSAQRIEIIGE